MKDKKMGTTNGSKSGKTYIDKDGYRRFTKTDDLVHLWVAKKKYKNESFTGKEVHHLDGDKTNNKEENLILLHKDDHYRIHEYMKNNSIKGVRVIHPWAWTVLIIAVGIQLPLFWLPYITQFITVILVLIVILAGTEKK